MTMHGLKKLGLLAIVGAFPVLVAVFNPIPGVLTSQEDPCYSCDCPTIDSDTIQVVTDAVVTKLDRDPMSGLYDFELELPVFEAACTLTNPGKAGRVGFVKILTARTKDLMYPHCSCLIWEDAEIDNLPLNDGRTKVGEPCSSANCPWAPIIYQYDPSLPRVGACSTVAVSCEDDVDIAHADAPKYGLSNWYAPALIEHRHTWDIYIVWECDGSREIVGQTEFSMLTTCWYAGECPKSPAELGDYQVMNSPDVEDDPASFSYVGCEQACDASGGPIDCSCDDGYANYDSHWTVDGKLCP